MSLFIIVPVKSLQGAKSRLSEVLDEQQRRTLAVAMLENVLSAVQLAQERLPGQGIVISADVEVLALARAYGLMPLAEELHSVGSQGNGDAEAQLNSALTQACDWAQKHGGDAVLVLPADLPLLTVEEIEGLWLASQQLYSARAMVIAPDGREQGTNGLLMRPPGALAFQFGFDSFRRHCDQARDRGMAWHVHRSPRLGLDIDVPVDLEAYLAVETADADDHVSIEGDRVLFDDQAEAFLAEGGHLMRLGTIGRDGFPQVTPVWYLFQNGLFYITTAHDRIKARNMLANPRVGFAVDSEVKPYRGLTVWGKARLVTEGEDARSLTRQIAARYVPAGRLDLMVDTLMQSPRVIIVIEPLRAAKMGSW
ncbi:MAG: 2-phospho-L-lactate guanylyltransferase [Chloroflexota bacterium]|nr:2-phospho-L-lactate guanylyltransferase [Chloroflexota bacterium]